MSFAKNTSMSYVAGYRAANFIMMAFPAYEKKICKRAQLHQQTNKRSPHHNSKKKSAATAETNVLPNATQSYASPPAIFTAPLRPLETYRPRT